MRLVEIGRPFEQLRARFATKRVPGGLRRVSGANHPVHLVRGRFESRTNRDAVVVGRDDGPPLSFSGTRLRGPAARFERFEALHQGLAYQRITEVDASAVAAAGSEQIRRQYDLRVPLRLQRGKVR